MLLVRRLLVFIHTACASSLGRAVKFKRDKANCWSIAWLHVHCPWEKQHSGRLRVKILKHVSNPLVTPSRHPSLGYEGYPDQRAQVVRA